MYRWQLKKGGRKLTCPACGQKRFVPFVSTADGKTLAGVEFGRCDRETSCGYFRYPHSEIKAPAEPIPTPPEEPPIYFQKSVLDVAPSALLEYVSGLVGRGKALKAWASYEVGATAEGRTLFWQIDKNGLVRAGKAIFYKEDGHRDKNAIPPVHWAHKMKAFEGRFVGSKLVQCFFGEHLLEGNNNPVAVVESEKTAIVCSVVLPEFVWLACGGSQNLKNPIKNSVLAGREVVLIPDRNQYWQWYEIALKNRWRISKVMEQNPPFEGADLLDKIERDEEFTIF